LDVIRAIETRRSIGRVKQEPVPRELIERILESGVHAPNHRITEPWRFHVFSGKGRGELARVRAEIARLQAEAGGKAEGWPPAGSAANARKPFALPWS
jgi:nitroreductase